MEIMFTQQINWSDLPFNIINRLNSRKNASLDIIYKLWVKVNSQELWNFSGPICSCSLPLEDPGNSPLHGCHFCVPPLLKRDCGTRRYQGKRLGYHPGKHRAMFRNWNMSGSKTFNAILARCRLRCVLGWLTPSDIIQKSESYVALPLCCVHEVVAGRIRTSLPLIRIHLNPYLTMIPSSTVIP